MPMSEDAEDFFAKMKEAYENMTPEERAEEAQLIKDWDVTVADGLVTGIPCFRCKKRSGINCPGRKPDEPTLCNPCFQVQRLKDDYEQAAHLLKCLDEGMFDEEKFYEYLKE